MKLFFLISLLHLSICCFATDYYVSSSIGSDSNPGTIIQPVATVVMAQSLASSGDKIYLKSGDAWTSFTMTKQLSLLSWGSGFPQINGGITINATGTSLNPIVLNGIKVLGGYSCLNINNIPTNKGFIEVQNCVFQSGTEYGIFVNGGDSNSSISVSNSQIIECGNTLSVGSGAIILFDWNGKSSFTNSQIVNITNPTSFGIQLSGLSVAPANTPTGQSDDCLIQNCSIIGDYMRTSVSGLIGSHIRIQRYTNVSKIQIKNSFFKSIASVNTGRRDIIYLQNCPVTTPHSLIVHNCIFEMQPLLYANNWFITNWPRVDIIFGFPVPSQNPKIVVSQGQFIRDGITLYPCDQVQPYITEIDAPPFAEIDLECVLNVILPVELISFEGKREKNEAINLEWKTASEVSFREFAIYSSLNGLDWKIEGNVKAKGSNSSYQFINNSYNPYWKLGMIDEDESQKFSKIIFVPSEKVHCNNELLIQQGNIIFKGFQPQAVKCVSLTGQLIFETYTYDGKPILLKEGMYIILWYSKDCIQSKKILVYN